VSGFLEQMATSSHARAAAAAARVPLTDLRIRAGDAAPAPRLRHVHAFDLIAEYKRRSPALGALVGAQEDLAGRVRAYARGGAAAVSVLTEPSRFGGDLAQLADAAAVLAPHGVPVLRKDFLVEPYQLYESRAAGAGGVLLIVRLLDDARMSELLDCALEAGLFVLLEAFDDGDVARAAQAPQRGGQVLVGVNCRNLATLAVDPGRFRALASGLPRDRIRVAESGIGTPEDCAELVRSGYDMALVGGALMTAEDPEKAVAAMLAAGRAAA
jgi:indole-3-glycerol phosphate synthase